MDEGTKRAFPGEEDKVVALYRCRKNDATYNWIHLSDHCYSERRKCLMITFSEHYGRIIRRMTFHQATQEQCGYIVCRYLMSLL